MSTPSEPWRRRKSARLYDTEPRMSMGVTGERPESVPERGSVPDLACHGCGYHECSCEPLEFIEPAISEALHAWADGYMDMRPMRGSVMTGEHLKTIGRIESIRLGNTDLVVAQDGEIEPASFGGVTFRVERGPATRPSVAVMRHDRTYGSIQLLDDGRLDPAALARFGNGMTVFLDEHLEPGESRTVVYQPPVDLNAPRKAEIDVFRNERYCTSPGCAWRVMADRQGNCDMLRFDAHMCGPVQVVRRESGEYAVEKLDRSESMIFAGPDAREHAEAFADGCHNTAESDVWQDARWGAR